MQTKILLLNSSSKITNLELYTNLNIYKTSIDIEDSSVLSDVMEAAKEELIVSFTEIENVFDCDMQSESIIGGFPLSGILYAVDENSVPVAGVYIERVTSFSEPFPTNNSIRLDALEIVENTVVTFKGILAD